MNRVPTYLRISVTDRCDLRCVYCRPAGDENSRTFHSLRGAEVAAFVRAAAACGLTKVRLTGGEPLLSADIVEMVRGIRAVEGIRCLGLTTNGQRLAALAGPLHEAGLRSVNVSLPSLRVDTYRRITGGDLGPVLTGLEMVLRLGYDPVKLNVVLMRGVNDGEIEALGRLAEEKPVEVRFIECMPFRRMAECAEPLVPAAKVLDRLRGLGPLSPAGNGDERSAARMCYIRGFRGRVGVIAPMTAPFCGRCNRIRLTATGRLRACLVDGGEVDAREALAGGTEPEPLRRLLESALRLKPARHRARFAGAMACIGG